MSTNNTSPLHFAYAYKTHHKDVICASLYSPFLSRVHSKLSQLNPKQAKMVKEKSQSMAELVPPQFKIDWRKIVFVKCIGSGSFGDCYQGTRAGRPVAIKKMRAGSFAA